MTEAEIRSIKDRIELLRAENAEKMGRIHKRKTKEYRDFETEIQKIQADCEHPSRSSFGLGASEQCDVCLKVWSFFR